MERLDWPGTKEDQKPCPFCKSTFGKTDLSVEWPDGFKLTIYGICEKCSTKLLNVFNGMGLYGRED